MKKPILFAAVFALSYGAQAAAEDHGAHKAMDQKVVESSFEVFGEDGTSATMIRYEDGTYVIGDSTGTYYEKDGKTCYLGDSEGAEESCWSPAVEGDDGIYRSTSDDGTVVELGDASSE